MTPVRSQNNCVVLKVSEPAIRSVASRRVRKSRGEQATVRHNTAKMKAACRRRILARDCNQTRASPRQERTAGDLPFKPGRPPPRNHRLAGGALAVRSYAVILHKITAPSDQRIAAVMAARVFKIADLAGQISRVNVAQTGFPADLGGAHQIARTSVGRVIHFVVFVESSYMPGNVGRDAGQKIGEAFQFGVGIIETRNQQSNDLQPHSHVIQGPNSFENGPDPSSQFVVVAIVEALEIHLVEIHPRPDVFQHLRGAVSVRYKAGDESGSPGLLEYLD